MPNTQELEKRPGFLQFLPVSLFGGIIGITGLYFCWDWAEKTWGFTPWIKWPIGILAIALFVVLAITYLLKTRKYPALVKAEFQNPVSVSFFSIIIISLLLLPGIILPYNMQAATITWTTGAILMFLFAWMVLRKWMDNRQDPANAMPVWVIPVVGTLDVPIVGAHLPIRGVHEICLVFFGIGLIFAIILLTIIISRLFFYPPLPEALQPTLLILVGPFALAFTSYESLTGTQDIIASAFYYFDLFLLLLLGSKIWLIPKCCPFRVSWWAVSFPLAAITIASFRYASHKSSVVFQVIPAVLLVITTAVILFLLVQTFYRIITGRLFLADHSQEKATRQLEPAAATRA